MTKQDIINRVARKLDIRPGKARPIVEAMLELLNNSLEKGENVEINGFGKFIIRQKNKRVGRNPMTGVEAEISRRKVVVFKPSKLFKNAVNGTRTQNWEED